MTGSSDLRIQLNAALTANAVAQAVLRTARLGLAHDALGRALGRNEGAVRTALAILTAETGVNPAHFAQLDDGGAEMERRALLRLSSYATLRTLTPVQALERLAHALQRRDRVEGPVLDAAEQATAALADRYYDAGTADLRLAATAHLERLNRLQQRPMAPADRVRLTRLVADAALLVGTLAYDLGLAAQARAYYQLAQQSAGEAADPFGYALALGFEALTRSSLMSGAGDSGQAAAQLRQATRLLPAQAPPRARAWLHAHAGKEAAATGDAGGLHTHLEAAQEALARVGDEPGGDGFAAAFLAYTDLPGWGEEYHARGLVLLDDDRAETVLDTLDRLVGPGNPRRRATLLTDRMRHHLQHGEHDQAARAGMDALQVARPAGLRRIDGVVRALRHTLGAGGGREMAPLDDLLGAAT